MNTPQELLQHTTHRPWPLPVAPWVYYQEWNRTLFLHWKVPLQTLKKLVPAGIAIDTDEAHNAWISLVAFTMERTRRQCLPSFSIVSDFHEINVRTYVTSQGKPGVYFLNIEAQKVFSAWLARTISALPYEKADIRRGNGQDGAPYNAYNKQKGFHLDADYRPGLPLRHKTTLDKWLTERYCLYLKHEDSWYINEIHHQEWPLRQVTVYNLDCRYRIGSILLDKPPDQMHYSDGVQVLAWKKEPLEI